MPHCYVSVRPKLLEGGGSIRPRKTQQMADFKVFEMTTFFAHQDF